MKKLLFVFLAAALIFSCQKKEELNAPQTQDVVFSAINVNPGDGLKASPIELPCIDEEPDYAKVVIGGVDYYPTVYRLDGKLYTQAIKLDVISGSYTVTQFGLWHDVSGDGPSGDDQLVMATPSSGSTYSEYVSQGVPFDITVTAFAKAEVPVEVLCFQPEVYTDFGFEWFSVTETVIREFCFFGDICLNGDPYSPDDFDGSLYGTALGNDVPAIMKIKVYRNGNEVVNSPFDNEGWKGIGAPLCVQYPDDLGETEVFTFELYLWLKTDAGWSYQLYHTYTSSDDGILMFDDATVADVDENGVVEFVVGTCNYSDTDHTFPWLCPPNYYQPFDSDDGDWFEYPGPMTISGGVNVIENGAFTRFDGYLSVWPGTWTAEAVVYLDPAWADGEGFDYSVAAQGTDGAHQRDFIFHVSKDISEGKLLIGGSTNSNFGTRQDLETINHYEITTAGYYTLQHVFYDAGGYLAVDLNLVDGGTVVWTETLEKPAEDLIPSVVGGNRYGWFIFIDVTGGLMVDEASLIRDCNN